MRPVDARSGSQARHGARFWDAVEREIEALDAGDLALFLAADHLPIEPRASFRRGLRGHLQALCRARWSN
ncbi:MAG TPA: hypothetical protein VMR31_00925 [Myxococcota bacterium]|nr:hypothetical protein [Myxococcota bacterium]